MQHIGRVEYGIVGEVDVVLRVDYGPQPVEEERADVVVRMRVVGMRALCDLHRKKSRYMRLSSSKELFLLPLDLF